jgi:hypothetical protein
VINPVWLNLLLNCYLSSIRVQTTAVVLKTNETRRQANPPARIDLSRV